MRFLVFLLSLSLYAAEVDRGKDTANTTSDPATVTLTGCAGANRAIAITHYAAYLAAGFSISDSFSASWTTIPAEDSDTIGVTVYYSDIVTFDGTDTVTVTPSSGTPGLGLMFICFTSAAGAPSVAGNNTGAGTANSIQAGSVTPATGGDVYVAAAVWADPANPTLDEGFTVLDNFLGAHGQDGWVAYLFAPSTSALNPTWTIPAGPHSIAAVSAAFPAPTSGAFSGVIE